MKPRRLAIAASLILACGAPPASEERATLPGAEPLDLARAVVLLEAVVAAADDQRPVTAHRWPDGSPRFVNRLLAERSPYLRQHAHDPVDWYAWGEAAFEAARRLDRPILLSIGYSTCHWCHVMAEESFQDLEIARYLNQHYVAIKVDRELRPDIDAVYLEAVQAMTGRGGWPLTVWLTPTGEPFHGGTYFPPRTGARPGTPGLLDELRRLAGVYERDPDMLRGAGRQLAREVARRTQPAPPAASDLAAASILHAAAGQVLGAVDVERGGLRGAPKFPGAVPLRFLLRYHRRTGEPRALEAVVNTLEAMARGGIHDHIGGGFHRYATDADWRVPHFEKMLYDNALLVIVYLEAYQVTGRDELAAVAGDVLAWVEREMTSPEGGFYAALDADTRASSGELREGWYYTWTPAELRAALGEELAAVAAAHWQVTEEGDLDGRSVLTRASIGAGPGGSEVLQQTRERLRAARARRPAPARDDKIIVEWNALMISALARAARVLDRPAYLRAARQAMDLLLTRARPGGVLARALAAGQPQGRGFLGDHAAVLAALLDLFEATGEARWLREAIAVEQEVTTRFATAEGPYARTSGDHEALLIRDVPVEDGALPSGNALMASGLLRLAALTGDAGYRRRAERVLAGLGGILQRRPAAAGSLLLAVDHISDRGQEVVVVAGDGDAGDALWSVLATTFAPSAVVVPAGPATDAGLAALTPLVAGKVARGGAATAYVCEGHSCQLPTGDPEVFRRQLAEHAPLAAR